MILKHTVTKEQEKRIGIKAGTIIECQLKKDSELPPSLHGTRVAKWYAVNGQRRGGDLALDE